MMSDSSAEMCQVDLACQKRTLLRNRVAMARRESAVLADIVSRCRASKEAIMERGRENRLRWTAWRAGMAWLATRARFGEAVLRVCILCDAVCFGPQPVAGGALAERWVDPPASIRERFRNGWDGPSRTHDICPQCLRADELPIDTVVPREAGLGRDLLAVFERIDESAATIVAGNASIGADEALELAYHEVVGHLAEQLSEAELRALVAALRALTHHLGGEARLHEAREIQRRTDARRFHPPLRAG